MTITVTVSNTTFSQLRTKVNQVIGVVNTLGTGNVSNTYLQATFATKAYAASNVYVKTLLANTNAYIATRASWSALTSTNTAIRNYVDSKASQLVNGSYNLTLQANSALRLPSGVKLISGFPGFGQYLSNFATLAGDYAYLSSANGYSYIGVENQVPVIGNGPNMWAFDPDGTIRFPDNTIQSTAYTGSAAYLQVSNANAKFATKAYAASNTAVRLLISDRIQVANVAARYATKAYAASNAYVKLVLANTNAYIAAVAASSGGGNGVILTSLSSSLIPSSNVNFDLGSPTKRWRSLYLSNNTIYLGTARITVGTNNNIVFIANNQPAKIEAAALVVTANTPSSFQNLTITNLVLNNVLGTQYGGTGKSSLTQNGVMYASNSTAFAFATGSNGKIMQIGSNGVPKFDDVDGGSFP